MDKEHRTATPSPEQWLELVRPMVSIEALTSAVESHNPGYEESEVAKAARRFLIQLSGQRLDTEHTSLQKETLEIHLANFDPECESISEFDVAVATLRILNFTNVGLPTFVIKISLILSRFLENKTNQYALACFNFLQWALDRSREPNWTPKESNESGTEEFYSLEILCLTILSQISVRILDGAACGAATAEHAKDNFDYESRIERNQVTAEIDTATSRFDEVSKRLDAFGSAISESGSSQ